MIQRADSAKPVPQDSDRPDDAGSPATPWAIDIAGLTRRYGATRALCQVDLAVPWDQRLGLFGPNGAGKTTLVRILATLVRPTTGTVVVGGLALPSQAAAVRCHVGYVGHQTFLYDELSVRENLQFYGRLYRIQNRAERITTLIERVGLADRADDRVRTLSRGLQQRAALARAVLHDPTILLLDEPDSGLDIDATSLISDLLVDELGRPRTVILTTHQVDVALRMVERVVVIARGAIVLDAPVNLTSASEVARAIRQSRITS
ncbi:MAG TPA: heme ABC exporter ATP-binding protein CcmA [Chloroflexota bacterium]|nr:heme ABC exporter ATP-binding protein CcmA [Chloroflexota bacterium]